MFYEVKLPKKRGGNSARRLTLTKPSLQLLHEAFSQHSSPILVWMKLMSQIALTNLTLRHISVFQLDLDLATTVSNLSHKHLSSSPSSRHVVHIFSLSLSLYRPNPCVVPTPPLEQASTSHLNNPGWRGSRVENQLHHARFSPGKGWDPSVWTNLKTITPVVVWKILMFAT